MFKRIFYIFLTAFCFISSFLHAGVPVRTGWWKFDNSTALTNAESGYGQALNLVGSHAPAVGPEQGNGAVLIGAGSYYSIHHGISPNGGGSNVNEYSLQYDFKITGNGIWYSFFQTAPDNSNDGDFFINPTGNIGVADVGYSGYSVIPGQWYRLVISVKNGDNFTCYLDGRPFLSGATQSVDGRFSLENQLLVFADDNGEDGEIYCAELALWNQALDAAQVLELGGYGNDIEPVVMTRIPYLQGEGPNSMHIGWHDAHSTPTIVKYGVDSSLANLIEGTSEVLKDPYCWHTVKLTGLLANTRYFYKVGNGTEFSGTYSFRTLPDASYTGKLRFILLSDTHSYDSTAVNKVLRSARNKITELYGTDIENHVNGIFHSGDIVVNGNVLEQYTTQFFKPLAILSGNLPTMVVAGNHEGENNYFYKYLKLDDQSAFPQNSSLDEKVWSLQVGNALFIGLNTNIISQFGFQEAIWLDAKLDEAEQDSGTDFVFLFMHHFPFSELWNVSDESIYWVKNTILPILNKYTKVRELHYGHTHGYERGTVKSDVPDGDFSIICGGGGGGALDPWNISDNLDHRDIHISYSEHSFQILEIDIAGNSYHNTAYSIGTPDRWKNAETLDCIYRKNNQLPPDIPAIDNVVVTDDSVSFLASEFSGPDSLMSVELQVIRASNNQPALDTIIHWKNIYGVDAENIPVNRNLHFNLNRITITRSLFLSDQSYKFRLRYRDHNKKWSEWSAYSFFSATGESDITYSQSGYQLFQNFPNPFNYQTTISYYVPESCEVRFMIYDLRNSLIATINEGNRDRGIYKLIINDIGLTGGTLFYQMITPKTILTKKMTKVN